MSACMHPSELHTHFVFPLSLLSYYRSIFARLPTMAPFSPSSNYLLPLSPLFSFLDSYSRPHILRCLEHRTNPAHGASCACFFFPAHINACVGKRLRKEGVPHSFLDTCGPHMLMFSRTLDSRSHVTHCVAAHSLTASSSAPVSVSLAEWLCACCIQFVSRMVLLLVVGTLFFRLDRGCGHTSWMDGLRALG